jgi:pantetheine-phosphate adenylyltransferase
MIRAVYPGSFDPMTNGHLDLIDRSATLFDELVVAVLVNPGKSPLFTLEQRVELVRHCVRHRPNVRVGHFSGLLVDYAARIDARIIVRGLRAVSDFEYEFQMALMNRRMAPTIETVFLMPAARYSFLSSSLVKEVRQLGGDITGLVPPIIDSAMQAQLEGRPWDIPTLLGDEPGA